MGNCMKQKSKISGNVPARWHAFYACGLCLLVSVLIVTGVFGAVSLSGCSMIKNTLIVAVNQILVINIQHDDLRTAYFYGIL